MDISLLALRSSVDLSQSISFFNDCKRTSGTRQSNNWIAVDAIRREHELVRNVRGALRSKSLAFYILEEA